MRKTQPICLSLLKADKNANEWRGRVSIKQAIYEESTEDKNKEKLNMKGRTICFKSVFPKSMALH